MKNLLQDIRYGVRVLAGSRGFTLVAIASLAIGIAANTSIFSVFYAVLLRPLPFANPARLVAIEGGSYHLINTFSDSPGDYLTTKHGNSSFESLAVYDSSGSVNLIEGGPPERILTTRVSTNFFSVLGVNPSMGRNFLDEEGKVGSERVVILGHDIWHRRFNSNPDLIGANVKLNGYNFTIVGVMPRGFEFPQFSGKTEMFIPLIWNDKLMAAEGSFSDVIARLNDGVSLERAQLEMDTITSRAQQEASYKVDAIKLVSLANKFSGEVGAALWMLLGAVGFVLLIACANVAGLLLVRAASRQKEVAIRAAVGASRKRLMRQFLTESVILALFSAVVGVFLSWLSLDALISISPVQIPQFHAIEINQTVLMFTLGVSLATGIVFGLAPALQSSRPDLNACLKEGGNRSRPLVKSRLRKLLIISEIALALVLLVGATLMLTTFRNLMSVERGFDSTRLLTFEVAPPDLKYPERTDKAAFYQDTIESIRKMPGVESVGGANHIPLASKQGRLILRVSVFGGDAADEWQASGDYRVVSPNYFRTLGMALLKGRDFEDRDDTNSERVVIINATLARTLFEDDDPIGKRLLVGSSKNPIEVIGVVADIRNWGLTHQPAAEFYLNYQQSAPPFLGLAVRTKGDPRAMIATARNAVWAIDPEQPLYNVRTMEEAIGDSISKQRFSMVLLTIFSAVACILAFIGIYGITSYSVGQRTHDIGVHMALGASEHSIAKMFLSEGSRLIGMGLTVGLIGALLLSRVLSSLLYDVKPTDPVVLIAAANLLGLASLAACYIPARRATKVDPLVALRHE